MSSSLIKFTFKRFIGAAPKRVTDSIASHEIKVSQLNFAALEAKYFKFSMIKPIIYTKDSHFKQEKLYA
jgi:hypothetical protein